MDQNGTPTPEVPTPLAVKTQEQPIGSPLPSKKPIKLFIILGVLIIGILGITGVFLGMPKNTQQTAPEPTSTPTPSPTPIPPTSDTINLPEMQFLPGKQYYNDTLSIVTRDNPHQLLTVSATRAEQETNFLQYTTTNYFDGTEWTRDTLSNTNTKSDVASNTIIRSWYSSSGTTSRELAVTLLVNGVEISLTPTGIQDEILLLSLPDYTKLIAQGTGKVIINGTTHDAYYAYTRAYSLNASSLAFFNTPSSLTNSWLALWDDEGTFYIADSLSSKNGTSPYQNYNIGAVQSNKGTVQRVTSFSVEQDRGNTGRFRTTLTSRPIDFAYLTTLSKTGINESYAWNIGPVDGTVNSSTTSNETKSSYVLGFYEEIYSRK